MGRLLSSDVDRTDTATTLLISDISNSLAVTLAAADLSRLYFYVKNTSNKAIWLRPIPAATNNNHIGWLISSGGQFELRAPMYTGELSLIAESGNNGSIAYVEL